MTDPVLAVIPSRIGSSRLPRKPLHPILGRPLVQWVWESVSAMSLFDRVVVATDSQEVLSACRGFGAEALMTDPGHASGTDRVAEVAARTGLTGFGIVANVQGDEPLVREDHLAAAVELVRSGPWDVGTCATPLHTEEELHRPSTVKAVRAEDGRALYFSRAGVPFKRDAAPSAADLRAPPFLRHLGIYVYRRSALLRWVDLPPSVLERLEGLEQLRALEAGIPIGVAVVEEAAPGVDTEDDVASMEEALLRSGRGSTRDRNTPTFTYDQ